MELSKFTKLYPLSKTLRFELKPVDESADYIEQYGSDYIKELVKADDKRSGDYQKIKSLIDDFHRDYIDRRLSGQKELTAPVDTDTGELVITPQDLEAAFYTYSDLKNNPIEKKEWESCQADLRKKLVKIFSDTSNLFGKTLITKSLPSYLKSMGRWEEHQELVESFGKFTTYFTGFDENRKNMYVADDKVTSIANRAINQNLPKFFDNLLVYKNIQKNQKDFDFSFTDEATLTKLGLTDLSESFRPDFYLKLFSQRGIEAYQDLLGGKTDGGTIVEGLNQKINLYRQQHENLKSRNFPTFTRLHKQILANTTSSSFSYEPYDLDQDLLTDIERLIDELRGHQGHLCALKVITGTLKTSDTSMVFIRGNTLNQLSNEWLGNFALLGRTLDYFIEESGNFSTKKEKDSYKKRTKDLGYFSISEVQSWVDFYLSEHDAEANKAYTNKMQTHGETLIHYFADAAFRILQEKDSDSDSLKELERKVLELLTLPELSRNRRPPKTENDEDEGGKGFRQAQEIQQLLNRYIQGVRRFSPLHLVHKRKPINLPEQDLGFYNEFADLFELISESVLSVYNKSRNHLSKKPFSTEKVKINFYNPKLMSGWDVNKESNNSCVLFRKSGNYFLGVMHPKHRKLFDYTIGIDELGKEATTQKKLKLKNQIETNSGGYEKIVYKLLPGANKMLPKVFFSKGRIDHFSPSDEVLRIRNTASHSKNGLPQSGHEKADFNLKDCHTLIDFFRASIENHYEWRQYDFRFSDTSEYQDISEFYKEVHDQAYKIEFDQISDEYIDESVKSGKLFLFQIYNKDFSPRSKGTPNLHTLYWRGLFDKQNLSDVVLKLNGEAEMFFRRHSIKREDRTLHEKNKGIPKKNESGQSIFPYDIVKNKRYTTDKFFLHIPITLNYKAANLPRFNDAINRAVLSKTNVIGIDRGERHLLYYCVVNPEGKIIEQNSLNVIEHGKQTVDYQNKLEQRQKLRDQARKSWGSIENIKELKHGYLSQVVHKLAQLVIQHKAIVCLEDLNFGFKRGRFKVEKQVYQKFEKALIDKLNYLVDKQETNPSVPGHYLNAFQLTAPFESFEKLGKQSGILYYVGASYTSKICPVTGFVNLLKPHYRSVEKSKKFFSDFEEICFNTDTGNFEFEFDYKNTSPERKQQGCRTRWRVCSYGERLVAKKDEKGFWLPAEPISPTEKLMDTFERSGIDFSSGENLIETILEQDSAQFFKDLFWGLRLMLQMRNSRSDSTAPEHDYLISPVADEDGCHYDSRNPADGLPTDADANGAYHIALKGLWNIAKITEHDWSEDKPAPLKLSLSNEEWFRFAQNKPFR